MLPQKSPGTGFFFTWVTGGRGTFGMAGRVNKASKQAGLMGGSAFLAGVTPQKTEMSKPTTKAATRSSSSPAAVPVTAKPKLMNFRLVSLNLKPKR